MGLPESTERIGEHVERQFRKACKVRRGLDDHDEELFWKIVRDAAKILTG